MSSKRKDLQRCTPVQRLIDWPVETPFGEPVKEIPMPTSQLAELQVIVEPRAKKVSPTKLMPTLVQEIKDKLYKNFTIPVGGAAFTDRPLSLVDLGVVADEMTIISFPAGNPGLSYKLNHPTNDSTPILANGQKEDQFELEEVYITDTGVGPAGNLIIRVVWNPYLIRLSP